MVSDIRNSKQVEHFLRNASAAELLEQRNRIQDLIASAAASAGEVDHFVARIAYELRFRVAQPI